MMQEGRPTADTTSAGAHPAQAIYPTPPKEEDEKSFVLHRLKEQVILYTPQKGGRPDGSVIGEKTAFLKFYFTLAGTALIELDEAFTASALDVAKDVFKDLNSPELLLGLGQLSGMQLPESLRKGSPNINTINDEERLSRMLDEVLTSCFMITGKLNKHCFPLKGPYLSKDTVLTTIGKLKACIDKHATSFKTSLAALPDQFPHREKIDLFIQTLEEIKQELTTIGIAKEAEIDPQKEADIKDTEIEQLREQLAQMEAERDAAVAEKEAKVKELKPKAEKYVATLERLTDAQESLQAAKDAETEALTTVDSLQTENAALSAELEEARAHAPGEVTRARLHETTMNATQSHAMDIAAGNVSMAFCSALADARRVAPPKFYSTPIREAASGASEERDLSNLAKLARNARDVLPAAQESPDEQTEIHTKQLEHFSMLSMLAQQITMHIRDLWVVLDEPLSKQQMTLSLSKTILTMIQTHPGLITGEDAELFELMTSEQKKLVLLKDKKVEPTTLALESSKKHIAALLQLQKQMKLSPNIRDIYLYSLEIDEALIDFESDCSKYATTASQLAIINAAEERLALSARDSALLTSTPEDQDALKGTLEATFNRACANTTSLLDLAHTHMSTFNRALITGLETARFNLILHVKTELITMHPTLLAPVFDIEHTREEVAKLATKLNPLFLETTCRPRTYDEYLKTCKMVTEEGIAETQALCDTVPKFLIGGPKNTLLKPLNKKTGDFKETLTAFSHIRELIVTNCKTTESTTEIRAEITGAVKTPTHPDNIVLVCIGAFYTLECALMEKFQYSSVSGALTMEKAADLQKVAVQLYEGDGAFKNISPKLVAQRFFKELSDAADFFVEGASILEQSVKFLEKLPATLEREARDAASAKVLATSGGGAAMMPAPPSPEAGAAESPTAARRLSKNSSDE